MALQVDDVLVEVGRAATEGKIDMVELWFAAGGSPTAITFDPGARRGARGPAAVSGLCPRDCGVSRVFARVLVASLRRAQGALRQLVCRSSGARGGDSWYSARRGTARRGVAKEPQQEGLVY